MSRQLWVTPSLAAASLIWAGWCISASAQEIPRDVVRELQLQAIDSKSAPWGYWGTNPQIYANHQQHSNRLVPVYTFGMDLSGYKGAASPYRHEDAIKKLYGVVPAGTLNPNAEYFDQTQIHDLQAQAAAAGKKYIFLVIFDGMDWQTTLAAATVRSGRPAFREGRGSGLHFLDYRCDAMDYGFMVTSPLTDRCDLDCDSQTCVLSDDRRGGYQPQFGGATPWTEPPVKEYLIGTFRGQQDVVTDSASSGTSMCSGIKTYNAAINVDVFGRQVVPLPRRLQAEKNFAIGVVTSVPISHATPASAYANNVSRDDYQDLTREMLGLPSIAHRDQPLPGVDVLLGCGWGDNKETEDRQAKNFVPGNRYLPDEDLRTIDVQNGGRYTVAIRTAGVSGADRLAEAADAAANNRTRLLGFYGTTYSHLPYQTADGHYDPTRGYKSMEKYSPADLQENPTLAQMTAAAIRVLQEDPDGFWLMVEPGDVDWANHDDNIDNSIGAVFSGDEAVKTITDWIEARNAWNESLLIVTADHGHYFHLVDPSALVGPAPDAGTATTSTQPTKK